MFSFALLGCVLNEKKITLCLQHHNIKRLVFQRVSNEQKSRFVFIFCKAIHVKY
jgi:hypothetical protein